MWITFIHARGREIMREDQDKIHENLRQNLLTVIWLGVYSSPLMG
jgi:hypothetical protein